MGIVFLLAWVAGWLCPDGVVHVCADGWGFSQLGQNSIGEGPGALKHQIIGTLHAATYMRMPLVVLNILVIFLKLVIG